MRVMVIQVSDPNQHAFFEISQFLEELAYEGPCSLCSVQVFDGCSVQVNQSFAATTLYVWPLLIVAALAAITSFSIKHNTCCLPGFSKSLCIACTRGGCLYFKGCIT